MSTFQSPTKDCDQSRRILVIQLRELGDTLMTMPLLRELDRQFPSARIDVVCQSSNRSLIEHHPHVRRIFELKRRASVREFLALAARLRRERYGLIVDPQSLPKTALLARLAGGRRRLGYRRRWLCNRLCYTEPLCNHFFEYAAASNLRLLQDTRSNLADLKLDYFVSAAARTSAATFRRTYFRRPVAAIYGATRFEYRRWNPTKLAAIADRLVERGYQAFLVYGPGQQSQAGQIAQAMQQDPLIDYPMPSAAELIEILTGCRLFVGNDGGPRHFANAAGIPTVAMMGGFDAVQWTPPDRTDQRVVRTRYVPGNTRLTGNDRVAGRVVEAPKLQQISVDDVWGEIETLASLGWIDLTSRHQPAA